MKRSIIVSISVVVLLLLSILAVFSFWLEKISNWWFFGTSIGLIFVAIIGILVYKLRTKDEPVKIGEEKVEAKIKSTKKLVEYVKKVLKESSEPNELVNEQAWSYVAGQQVKSAHRKEFGIVEAKGVYYVGMWVYYLIAVNVRDPDEVAINKFNVEDYVKNYERYRALFQEILEHTADIPKEDKKTVRRVTDPYGRVVETVTSEPSQQELEDKEKEESESLEKNG